MGFDIPTWIKEGLVDYVAPSDFGFTDFNEKYEDFVRLARAYDCYVYPQVQTRMGIEAEMEMAPIRYRAAVQNFYGAGADGLSTQNYFFHWCEGWMRGPQFSEMYPKALNYLKELRSPERIAAAGDRHYVFLSLWANRREGSGVSGIYKQEEIVLKRDRVGARDAFRFRVCEHFPAAPILPLTEKSSGLTFSPVGLARGDALAIDINGKAIPPEHIRWTWYDEKDQPPSCKIALSSPPFVYGDNDLGLKITKNADGAEGDIIVEHVECMVRVEKG